MQRRLASPQSNVQRDRRDCGSARQLSSNEHAPACPTRCSRGTSAGPRPAAHAAHSDRRVAGDHDSAHAADASVLWTADAGKPASSESPIVTPAPKLKTPPASSKPSASAARRANPGVWLKLRKVGVAAKVRRGTLVSRIYGRVVDRSGRTRRAVVIELFRAGRWRRAIVTRSRRDGRFSLVRALPAGTTTLRAYVRGVGHSPVVAPPLKKNRRWKNRRRATK